MGLLMQKYMDTNLYIFFYFKPGFIRSHGELNPNTRDATQMVLPLV